MLKEHMRKKQHRKINPKNTSYDRFYIINYLVSISKLVVEQVGCEKTFRDKVVLKEHMRKKQHRKINPKNTSYDRFYIINYLVSYHHMD